MVDQEIRVLGDENIIANPKNSQKQYPLTFKAVSNVIVYGRKKDNLNFTVPIPEGVNFNFNLDRTSIIFADNFNLEEYSYIMVKNPFEEIQDFFYVSSLEELDPTGKEFNEFNDEVVKWLRRLVNIISNRCMIFETTLFKDLNNFPNIKSGQTFIRTDDGWTGITIRDINSELDVIFNKYVEEVNKKIQEHQVQMNELLEQWKQDIQKYAENVKQYEIVRVVTQTGHGFVFEPVMYSISQRKFVKAVFPHGADGVAVRVDDNNFRLVWAGRVEIPATAKDTQQRDFVLGEYYFLGEGSNGGIQREKPDTYYQHLFQVMYSDKLQQNIADVLLSVPINQKGKRWDIGEAKTTVNDIEELKMSDFPVGKVVEVLGYYSADDGATHKRVIDQADDGSGVQLTNGLWANIVKSNIYHSNWFGANKGSDVTDIFERIIMFNRPTIVDKGNYSLNKVLFDLEGIIKEDNGNYVNKYIIRTRQLSNYKPARTMIGLFDYNNIELNNGHQSVAYNKNKQEYILGFSNTESQQSVIVFLDKNFNFLRKSTVDLGHCNGLSYNPKINKIIAGGYLKYSGEPKDTKLFIINYDNLQIENSIEIGYTITGVGYDEEKDVYVAGVMNKYTILDCDFKIVKNININETETAGLISQDIEFFRGNYLTVWQSYPGIAKTHIISYDLKGEITNHYEFETQNSDDEVEGIFMLDDNRLLITEYYNKQIKFFELNFNSTSINNNEISTSIFLRRYVDSNAINEGDGSSTKPYKTINYALLDNISANNLQLRVKGIFKENISIYSRNQISIINWEDTKPIIKGSLYAVACGQLFISKISFKPEQNIDRIIYLDSTNLNASDLEIVQSKANGSDRGIALYRSLAYISNSTINNCGSVINVSESSACRVDNSKGIGNTKRYLISGGFVFDLGNNNFSTVSDDIIAGMGEVYPKRSSPVLLDTPYYKTKMQQEEVYEDYISYMDEKTLYDKQQRKLSEQRRLAYEEALKENPNLTYEEFMSVQPMTLNLVEEPQPSDALKKFMEKYL